MGKTHKNYTKLEAPTDPDLGSLHGPHPKRDSDVCMRGVWPMRGVAQTLTDPLGKPPSYRPWCSTS